MTFDTGGNRSLYTESVTSLTDKQKADCKATVIRLAGDDASAAERVIAMLGVEGS